MESSKYMLGKSGEELACRYLRWHGYRIIARNFRTKGSEIDIIARRGKFLVFCEVKTRSGLGFGTPAQAVDKKKIEHLITGAQSFIYENGSLYGSLQPRFDVIEILCERFGNHINHIKAIDINI